MYVTSPHEARRVPPDDFWVIDNKIVVFSLNDKNGRSPGGAAVSTDPEVVAYCQRTRERLWELATPFSEYVVSTYSKQ